MAEGQTEGAMDALYTIIVECEGGTYISQVNAKDERQALLKWCQTFPLEDKVPQNVKPLVHEVYTELTEYDDEITALNGLVSAWCADQLFNDKHTGINIIKTAP
ncbi:hypothetical protein OVA03_09700 [Asticcacaulis sp. SL142]|uniref:hypothetical protein n=1 Tax=Asticcacaulis sp. SL142 TaxID=2995155 RepID=UPI00226CA207|nr:hypothetical protein [Asticcacaulis sp. SL142]WAC46985.1 hypothetical protein OVA03_09700 [Asticcacaulis sp. SL142]